MIDIFFAPSGDVMTNIPLNIAIEIWSFPWKHGDLNHSCVNLYQKVIYKLLDNIYKRANLRIQKANLLHYWFIVFNLDVHLPKSKLKTSAFCFVFVETEPIIAMSLDSLWIRSQLALIIALTTHYIW